MKGGLKKGLTLNFILFVNIQFINTCIGHQTILKVISIKKTPIIPEIFQPV
jgi:hypothetical protein